MNSVKFSKYKNHFYSASTDKTVSMWDIKSGLLINTFYGHTSSINNLDISETENEVITCDAEGLVKLWDVRTMKCRGDINCGRYALNGVCLDPSVDIGFAASEDCDIYVMDL